MKKTEYIFIRKEVFTEMNLSGNDAILYALVSGYCENGIPFELKVDEIAKRVNITGRSVRASVDRLVKLGFLVKERKQLCIGLKISDGWKSLKSDVEIGRKFLSREEESSYQDRKKVPPRQEESSYQDRKKVPILHYNYNNLDKQSYNKGEEGDFYGILLEIFCNHYKVSNNGREYIPNHKTQTSSGRSLLKKIMIVMVDDGYIPTEDTFSRYFAQWIDLAWKRTDTFHRQRWSTESLDSNFNYFNQIVNDQPASNGNTRQHNQPNRGDQISNEYILRQFQKIADSRNGRSDGSGSSE